MIKNFESHVKNFGYSLKSNAFSMKTDNSIKWYLVIYPNGNKAKNSGFVSIFLCCERDEGSQIPVPTKLNLGFKKKGAEKIYTSSQMTISESKKKSNEWGWNRFMYTFALLDILKGPLANNTLIVRCVITLPTQSVVSTGRYFPTEIPDCCLRKNLASLLESESFCDVKLTTQGKVFNVHKLILAAMSPVFAAMFTTELKEKKDGVVEITDVEPDILENMLKFVYTGKIDLESVEMSSGLFVVADKYGLDRLKYLCEDYLCQNITVDNVLDLLVLTYLHSTKQLKGLALDFSNSNIILVRKTEKWRMLVERYPRLSDEIFEHHLLFEQGGK